MPTLPTDTLDNSQPCALSARLRFAEDRMDDDVKTWRLVGWDTFESEAYPVSRHSTEQECRAAAREFLRELETQQPSEQSGGQDGIQDRVFIVGPTGEHYRYERTLDA